MNLVEKLRRGEGPFWSRMKKTAKVVLGFHLPVNGLTRPVFRLGYAFHMSVYSTWRWGRRFFWNEPLFRSQCEAVGPGLWMEHLPYIQGLGRIVLGTGVRLSGQSDFIFGPSRGERPELVVGDSTFIGSGCGFHISRSIRIGSHCLVAGGVQVFDMDGHPLDAARRRAGESTPMEGIKPVVIGDDVWIGTGSIILKGVRIGDRSIIAARSVVTKDIPPDVIVAGNPARIVRNLTAADVRPHSNPVLESPAPCAGPMTEGNR